ncbi:hypothetical protein SAMN05216567_108104 [Variovorax sp. OK605]|jgi:hypothetical protein|nr:hypothetical protein SAMN05518853_10699 [Variovorax sp. OK202]SFD32246.1 hypothetical protein SAMN05444746_10699 [Variovorax sp. OK212]SFP71310.1 hypothetical protein SAMN05216567_108104 [Variovorax sp. OK605]
MLIGMRAPSSLLELPDGWSADFEIMRTVHGSYAGIAKLSLQGVQKCALVITQQLTWDGAFERACVRAAHFVKEWVASPRD